METVSKIVGALIAIAWILALVAIAMLWFAPIQGGREFLTSGWGWALLVFGVGPLVLGLVILGTGLVVSMIRDEGWKATFVMMAVLVGGGLLLWSISEITFETQGWTSLLTWLAGRVALLLGGLMVVCFPSWRVDRARAQIAQGAGGV